ncbi:ParA family partition ATPase [Moraxella sp. CTOTU49803]|uniref:ParA family partition ATPase n=1 Tax=Moraxella sp. CTOTU49803 TaxID=2953840 RepID=UPI0028AC8D33|nr:ParA family partition ATPase [Moraxella sp. CTOTU49803]
MPTIAVLNQKGGSGKTTIATHLARAYQLQGHSVLLIDSDKQGSARDWRAADENNTTPVIGLDRTSLDKDIKSLGKHDYIIIDGAPQATEIALAAIRASDFILIPVQPSPYDLWATANLIELIHQRIGVTEGKLKAAFVISRLIKNTKIGEEVANVLNEFDLPVLHSRIVQRICYPNSASLGKTVFETERSNSEAILEIQSLAEEIQSMMNN